MCAKVSRCSSDVFIRSMQNAVGSSLEMQICLALLLLPVGRLKIHM